MDLTPPSSDHPQPIPLPRVSCTSCLEHGVVIGGNWGDPGWGRSQGTTFLVPWGFAVLMQHCRELLQQPPNLLLMQETWPAVEKPPALTLEVGYFGAWPHRRSI